MKDNLMSKLPPWARGPFEILENAEGHYHGNSDIDRRLSLIGFDNAIEVAITTYLQLNPKLRGGQEFTKEDVQKWLRNYHTKLEFLEQHTEANGIVLESSTAEITWYHTLRNELYHSGNGMLPERHCLEGVRAAAIEVFEILFKVDAHSLLGKSLSIVATAQEQANADFSSHTRFLHSYMAFERALRASALALGLKIDGRAEGVARLWELFQSQASESVARYFEVVRKARHIRNELVHAGHNI